MPKKGWISISIPETLVQEVDTVIEAKSYTSRAEFIKEAIRRRLEDLRLKEVSV